MGGGTATVTTTKPSQAVKDAATALGLIGGGIAALGAVPEPGSPALIAAGAGIMIGSGIGYAGAIVLQEFGY